MPLYEYECDACGRRFERLQKFSDPPVETCPTCGGHVHKLLSSPAIQFKGSGWYVTDYARKGGGGGEADGKGKSTESAAGGEPAKDTSKDTAKDKPVKDTAAKEPSAPSTSQAKDKG